MIAEKYKSYSHIVKSWNQDEFLVYNCINGNTHSIDHDTAWILKYVDENKHMSGFEGIQAAFMNEEQDSNLRKILDKKLQELLAIELIYTI